MIEIEYMKHDEPAKTSVGEVAGYGYERRQGPCGRLTSDPWRSPPAAARGRRHAVCERGDLYLYKLAAPRSVKREWYFSLASICHAITDPPVTKIRLWASFGV